MRLIINALPLLGEESGINYYTRRIAAGLMAREECDVTLFYGYPSKNLVEKDQPGGLFSILKGFASRQGTIRRVAKYFLPLAYRTLTVMRPQVWDCYFEPNFALLPSLSAPRRVITVHDFSCFRNPQWHPQDRVAYMEKHFGSMMRQASHVITVSECIRQEAIEQYGFAPESITAIHHGVDGEVFHPSTQTQIEDLRSRYHLPPHFILSLGAIEPRKNLTNLILAHSRLPEKLRSRFPILFVGPPGWNNEEIMAAIHRHAPHTRLIGLVPQADLPHFYSACDLFVYPSWYEGFGLPVLEAMSCGRPVLASTASALMELSHGAAAHVPPEDVDAMSATLRQLLEDGELRQKMAIASIRRAADFSWQTSVQKHLDIFLRLYRQ